MFKEIVDGFTHSISTIGFIDVVDIILAAVILYYVFRFIADRRAGRLALGVVFLLVLYMISTLLDMKVIGFFLKNVFQVGLIALVVVFQPELRAALEKVGVGSIKSIMHITEQKKAAGVARMIGSVSSALGDLAETKTGALVVFERNTKLGDLVLTGTVIDADPAEYLIKNIFYNKAPLHDGAVIVRDGRLYSAGCLLPLSQNPDIIKDLGTRHRAAIGMSENSDAVVAVVSEETGEISLAVGGRLTRGFDREKLSAELSRYLLSEPVRSRRRRAKNKDAENDEGGEQ